MTEAIIQFAVTAGIITVAGSLLAKFADRFAEVSGLGHIFVGSIFLAGATSLPELMVDLNAVWLDQPNLAVGDLLGSSLFNLFILAILDIFFRHPKGAFSSEFGHHARVAVLSIQLTALVGIGVLSRSSFSLAGVGLFTWIVAIVYLVGFRITIFPSNVDSRVDFRAGWGDPTGRSELTKSAVGFLGAAGAILISAPYLVEAADRIARFTGLGPTFVGTTFVALSTSLPELVATYAAFRMGKPDLALGNIFGSNTFNMILIFPLDIFYPGAILGSVGAIHGLTALCIIAVTSMAALGQLSRKGDKARLWEPSSQLILLMTLGFLYLLYVSRNA